MSAENFTFQITVPPTAWAGGDDSPISHQTFRVLAAMIWRGLMKCGDDLDAHIARFGRSSCDPRVEKEYKRLYAEKELMTSAYNTICPADKQEFKGFSA